MQLELVPTPDGWADIALRDVGALLSDHAHCEKKAATTALGLLQPMSDSPDVVMRLVRLAEQETNHLRRVIEALRDLGYSLQRDQGNVYAGLLMRQTTDVVDRCIAAACIEARSHERLDLLTVALAQRPALVHLVALFEELRACEAGHAHTYLEIATTVHGAATVQARISTWQQREAVAIASVVPRCAVH
jgi:tRNA 2-(methylsulfanyl)-N6-isopentenyladenosine37 hydroxylase